MAGLRKSTEEEQERIMQVKHRLLMGIKDELLSGEVSKAELLGLMAHVTGMMIALQDQRTMSPEQAMNLVISNIENGNKSAVEQMFEGAFPV